MKGSYIYQFKISCYCRKLHYLLYIYLVQWITAALRNKTNIRKFSNKHRDPTTLKT